MSDTAASAERNIRETAKMLARINNTSAHELTKLLGVGRTGWYDRCNGKVRFSTADLATLAEYYKVPVQVFFDGPQALVTVPLSNVPVQHNRRSTDPTDSESHLQRKSDRRSQDGGSLTWRRWTAGKRTLPSGPVCRTRVA